MTLTPGTRVGPYEIVSAIGAGGMGEVYRARDTRLDRDVALKALPEPFATDASRLARFEREAKVLAALNHPNIAAIHGLEVAAGASYLVLEYVDGQSLAQLLTKGPLPLDDAVDIARQIADALEVAHEKGIIHRDLKPANIMLRADGQVKVLDFGLARMADADPTGDPSTSPTLTAMGTQVGMILGTAAYMSPEQAKGRVADRRSDVWAFGCVLYEMLTGKRAFAGDDLSDTLAGVLRGEPDWTLIPATVPLEIRTLIKRCLRRDRHNRVSDIGVARYVLDEAGAASTRQPNSVTSPVDRWRAPMWLGIATLVGIITASGAWWLKPMPSDHRVVTRFVHLLPEGQELSGAGLAVSPDGSKIVYSVNQQLYLRALDQLDAELIRGTNDNPANPVFSPDGQWLVYFANSGNISSTSTIKKIAVAGGTPITLGQAPSAPYGASWRGNTIYFAINSEQNAGIESVPADGGAVEMLIAVDPKKELVGHPQLLDDQHMVFDVRPVDKPGGSAQIVLQPLAGGVRKVLVDSGSTPYLLPTGQLVYVSGGRLFARPFDRAQRAVTGTAFPMVDGVTTVSPSFTGQFAISLTGTLIYWPARSSEAKFTLVWVDRQGQEVPIPAEPRPYRFPRLSPDFTKIAVDSTDAERDIWVFDLTKESLSRVTYGPAPETSPVWIDSRRLIYRSGRQLLRQAVDSTGPTETIVADILGGYPSSISPDGKWLMSRTGGGTADALMRITLDGSGRSQPLFAEAKYHQRNAEISPDGRWIAYDSWESGRRPEVYVRPFPHVEGGRWQISREGGYVPMWARSGRELFFVSSGRSQLMSVAVQTGSTFIPDKPRRVFDVSPYFFVFWLRAFDISSDDQRFLMVKPFGSDPATHPSIVVVSHWFDEVQARLGVK